MAMLPFDQDSNIPTIKQRYTMAAKLDYESQRSVLERFVDVAFGPDFEGQKVAQHTVIRVYAENYKDVKHQYSEIMDELGVERRSVLEMFMGPAGDEPFICLEIGV